ncbi:putative non-specific serine/threonine protein kinase [Helianthus debilis subsp. tardiflorus]
MDFEEFCAAALCGHQLEGLDQRERQSRDAYEIFEKDSNRPIVHEELAYLGSAGLFMKESKFLIHGSGKEGVLHRRLAPSTTLNPPTGFVFEKQM